MLCSYTRRILLQPLKYSKRCLNSLVDPPSQFSKEVPVFNKYDHTMPYWMRIVLMKEIMNVEAERKLRELKQGQNIPEADMNNKLVCRVCKKPNTITVHACTTCGFPLSKWDLAKPDIVQDLFGKIVRGELDTHKVFFRDSEIVVFGDGFPISECHLLSIPTSPIPDITHLNSSHIPLLKNLYQQAIDVMAKMDLPLMQGKNLEDWVIAGFNMPISVPHLHLHMVIPPLYHLAAFEHPRFHSYTKVLNDLQQFGRVITYHEAPNVEEGQKFYQQKVLDGHSALLAELQMQYFSPIVK